MKLKEHQKMMQVIGQRLERNINNTLTEDLITGMYAMINNATLELIDPAKGETRQEAKEALNDQ